MRAKALPTLEYLNECFELDETCPSGLRWKVRPRKHFPTQRGHLIFNSRFSGKPAGSLRRASPTQFYYQVEVLRASLLSHRVLYSMSNNIELTVSVEIDHRDGNGLNNLINNLRLVSSSENGYNSKLRNSTKTGIKGVDYRKDCGVYRGRVAFDGVVYSVGCSPSKEIIETMTRELREKLHREFANHG